MRGLGALALLIGAGPWQSGAAFFFRHLLDGDPASNTLSWRWVAGLQTPGKTYLARRGNLEKYLAPELRDSLSDGLAAFENPQALEPQTCAKPPVTRKEFPLKLQQVVALRPEVGPLHDSLPSLRAVLAKEGIRLALIDRPEDLRVRPFATGGFFQFWERLRKALVTNSTGNDFPEQQTLIESRQ